MLAAGIFICVTQIYCKGCGRCWTLKTYSKNKSESHGGGDVTSGHGEQQCEFKLWGVGGSNLRFRVKNRHAGRGLAASLVEKRQLDCPVWYRRAFVSVVHFKWSCGVLELSGRLDDRNRQWLEFKGLRTSGKILKSSHSALALYKRRARRLTCIYRGVEGLREVNRMDLFFSIRTSLKWHWVKVLNNPDRRNGNLCERRKVLSGSLLCILSPLSQVR